QLDDLEAAFQRGYLLCPWPFLQTVEFHTFALRHGLKAPHREGTVAVPLEARVALPHHPDLEPWSRAEHPPPFLDARRVGRQVRNIGRNRFQRRAGKPRQAHERRFDVETG